MSNLDFYIDRPATDELLNGLKKAIQEPATSPVVFHAYGMGGIGKTRLTQKITQDLPHAKVIVVDLKYVKGIETPLAAMEEIYRQLPPSMEPWGEAFTDKLRQYEATRRLIEQDGQGKELIKVTQSVFQAVTEKAVGEPLKHGTQAMLESTGTIEKFEQFLISFKSTKRNKELQDLMLYPFKVLTELLVAALFSRVQKQPLVLIFDTYEQARSEVDAGLFHSKKRLKKIKAGTSFTLCLSHI